MMNRLTKIRKLPCIQCGSTPAQVAHSNFGEHGKGRGIKADDEYTIPLCYRCHRDFDTYRWQTRAEAKAWFVRKLDLVNALLAGNTDNSETQF